MKFAGNAPLGRRDLNQMFGAVLARPDDQCWELMAFVDNVMAGMGWRVRSHRDVCAFAQEFGVNRFVCFRKWYEQSDHQPGQTVDEKLWPVCEKVEDGGRWTWYKNSMRLAEWVPTTLNMQDWVECPVTKKLVPFKNGYFKAVPLEE